MPDNVRILTDSSFDQEVLQAEMPALVDFWAEWCGPCKLVEPIVSEISSEYKDRVKVCKVDTDNHKKVSTSYRVSAVPTLILFKDGKEAERMVGAKLKNEIKAMIDRQLN